MASEADFSGFDFSSLENELFGHTAASTLKEGFKEDTQIVVEDLSRQSKRTRSQLAEAGIRIIEATYFNNYLCRQLSVTADRALTLASVSDDYLLEGEILDGPIHTTGLFTGLTFIQIPQLNFEPILGMELSEYQIVSGDRPNNLSRRLLVPIPDVGQHQFE